MKTKEKYRIIVMIGAAVILLFAILYFATYKETDILNISTDEIKSIYVTNGLNGDMVDVPSSDFCDFANALNEVKLKKGRKYRYRFKDIWNKRTVRSEVVQLV